MTEKPRRVTMAVIGSAIQRDLIYRLDRVTYDLPSTPSSPPAVELRDSTYVPHPGFPIGTIRHSPEARALVSVYSKPQRDH
jgi:hypothetical protein